MTFDIWLPVIGVVVGWLLHEISGLAKARFQDTRFKNQAIYSLLEVRFSASQACDVLEDLLQISTMGPNVRRSASTLLEDDILNPEYLKAVVEGIPKAISQFDPVAAQGVRILVRGIRQLSQFKSIDNAPDGTSGAIVSLDLKIMRRLIHDLDQQILDMVGPWQFFHKRRLKRAFIRQDDQLENVFEDILKAAEEVDRGLLPNA